MKKIVTLMLLSVCVSLSAETVSSVSYNPSRSGTYSNLKAADRITFLGGLDVTNTLNVISSATLEWNDSGEFHANSLGGTGELHFDNAVVSGFDIATDKNYSLYNANDNLPAPSFSGTDSLNFTMNGGKATFTYDSYVGNIDSGLTLHRTNTNGEGKLRVYAENVTLAGTSSKITVFGRAGAGSSGAGTVEELITSTHEPGPQTDHFLLVGGNIPDPHNAVGTELKWCEKRTCTNSACDGGNAPQVKVLCYK